MTCNLISTTRAVEMTFFRSRLEKKKVENFGRLTSVHFLSIFEGCPFVPNNALGKFKLLRALISPTAKNEPPDWLIFARAFFLLCYVTKERFQSQSEIHSLQTCFSEKRKYRQTTGDGECFQFSDQRTKKREKVCRPHIPFKKF